MVSEEPATKAVRLLYRPFGLVSGIIGGLVAARVFGQVWGRATRDRAAQAPKPLDSEYNLWQVLAAAAVQGAVFAVVKAAVDRAGARAFQRWTGEWPGD
jgi:hypothetical protein